MRRKCFCFWVFLLLVSAFFASPSFAYQVKTMQPLQPYQTPAGYQNYGTDGFENYPKITQVEAVVFNRNFEGENIYNRLNRIEQKLFKQQFQNLPLASRMDNILAGVDQGAMSGISMRDLSQMETRVFGQTFAREDTETRIARLEKEMLGAMQNGSLKQRYATVRTAAKHYNSFPQQYAQDSRYMPNTYNGQKPNFLTRIVDTLAGGMGMGTMTGFTPPIYDTYGDTYGNSYGNPYSTNYQQSSFGTGGYGQQDYYSGNNGGYYNNRNLGSGTGVRVFY